MTAPPAKHRTSNVFGIGSASDLHALVYVSSAAHLLSMPEIDYLLQRARARNLREAVTGVLLYSQGNFMQYLEGPATGLAKVYEKIKADGLHHGIIELLHEPIELRQFTEWTMGFCPAGRTDGLSGVRPDDRCGQRLVSPVGAAPATHRLVSKFWNHGLGPYAV